ncbi:MAG: MBL fold metallo-hydrolase [Chitinophagaceae bacterium]
MRKIFTAFFLFVLVFLTNSFQPINKSKHFTIQQLSPGVWAAINNDNYGHAICNAGIIDLGDKTVIFDPFMNIDAAKDLKQIAKELTKKDASVVINSHYHNDHIRGNQVFLPAAIISTIWTRKQIAISEPEELAWEKMNAPKLAENYRQKLKTASGLQKEELPLWIGYYEAMVTNGPLVKTTLPTVTFNDSLWIHGAKRSILLVEYKNGHSGSDVVMILPKEGIAFMGDLLFEKRHAYIADGNPSSWIKHLDEMYADPALQIFVPGHGKISGKSEVKQMSRYITDVQNLVHDAVQKGLPDSVIKKTPIPLAYADWKFGQFFGFNVNFLLKHKKPQ